MNNNTTYRKPQRPGVVTLNLLTRRESQTQGHHAYTHQVCEETSFQTMKFERDGGGFIWESLPTETVCRHIGCHPCRDRDRQGAHVQL